MHPVTNNNGFHGSECKRVSDYVRLSNQPRASDMILSLSAILISKHHLSPA